MKTQHPLLYNPFRKLTFLKKTLIFFLEIGGSILALLMIVIALFLGRLSMGPINIDFIIPEIEKVLKAPQVQIAASVEHAQLVWHEWQRPFEVELVNVHLQKGNNAHWLKIQHIGVSLRLMKLLLGNISLKALRFYRPHILLEKDEKGEFALGFGETQPDQQFSLKEIAPFLAFGGSHPSLGKLNELRKISIVDAHIFLKNEKENQEWELPKVTFVLNRQGNGFSTELKLRPQNKRGSLTLGVSHQLDSSRFNIYADFHHISLKDIIKEERVSLGIAHQEDLTPDDILDFFHHWNLPFHGKVRLTLIPETLQVIEGECNLDIGKGELSLAKVQPFPVESGNLSLTVAQNAIQLKNLSLLSGKTLFKFSGKLAASASPLILNQLFMTNNVLELNGKVEDFFLNHLSTLWPTDMAPEARNWLTNNLREGALTLGTFSLKGHGDGNGFLIDNLKGTLEAEGAEITYLQGLPPAQGVKAQASFNEKGFDIKLLSGKIKQIKLDGGHLLISNLDKNDEFLALDVKAIGPLSDLLDIINHKPLEYASQGGVDPKKAKGMGTIDFHIDFPLLADLKFKDVKMSAKGSFQKVELERKITEELNARLTQGDFGVTLTQDQMTIKGKGILNETPSQLTYTQSFESTSPQQLQLNIETNASFNDFKRFGFDYSEYGKGVTRASLTYTLENNNKSHLLIDLDTTTAALTFPPLGWEKRPGESGRISFGLLFENGHLFKMQDLVMLSPTYTLQGDVHFGPQKTWKTIHLSQLKGPHTHVQLTLHTPKEHHYEVSCKGQSVDLEKFLEYVNREENAINHPPTDIKLSADVETLRLGEKKTFENVHASANLFLQGKETIWKAVKLRAKAGKNVVHSQKSGVSHVAGGILFDITPGPNNTQTLEVRANDAGKFLKNLTIYDDIKEGYIVIKAQRKNKGPYAGVFKLKEFNVNKVPVLARFAALLSPMGVANLFSEKETLSMDRFECHFQFSEDLISVKDGVGKSLALGFTVNGKLDRKNRIYALKGNIVPARFINSILNNIPIIGSLLSGGEGEGLFGIAYSVSGSFDDPNVSLNPLSILAPGFIRKLFQSMGAED